MAGPATPKGGVFATPSENQQGFGFEGNWMRWYEMIWMMRYAGSEERLRYANTRKKMWEG